MKVKPAKRPTILGKSRRDAEVLRDEWLAENERIKILRIYPPKREPRVLLTLIGGHNVSRDKRVSARAGQEEVQNAPLPNTHWPGDSAQGADRKHDRPQCDPKMIYRSKKQRR
jgi:hypothetical protein